MHKVLPSSAERFEGITKPRLLVSIWRKPRATLAFILAKCPDEYVAVLFLLGGVSRAIERASVQQQNNKLDAGAILLLAVVMGAVSGLITSSLYTWGLTIVGRWLGGRGDNERFRVVVAWAQVPVAAGLLLLWPALVFLKDTSFRELRLAYPMLTSSVLPILFVAKLVLSSWTVVILLQGITLVQGFGTGRALANMLLPGVLVGAFILLIASLLPG
jgi:hypothetical protein